MGNLVLGLGRWVFKSIMPRSMLDIWRAEAEKSPFRAFAPDFYYHPHFSCLASAGSSVWGLGFRGLGFRVVEFKAESGTTFRHAYL